MNEDPEVPQISTPKTIELFYDSSSLGNVTNIKVNGTGQFLVVSFQDGSVLTWSLKTLWVQKHMPPMERCHIDREPFATNIFIDEYATYLAYLGENRREIHFKTLGWAYRCKKLPKPSPPGLRRAAAPQPTEPGEVRSTEQPTGLAALRQSLRWKRVTGSLLNLKLLSPRLSTAPDIIDDEFNTEANPPADCTSTSKVCSIF